LKGKKCERERVKEWGWKNECNRKQILIKFLSLYLFSSIRKPLFTKCMSLIPNDLGKLRCPRINLERIVSKLSETDRNT